MSAFWVVNAKSHVLRNISAGLGSGKLTGSWGQGLHWLVVGMVAVVPPSIQTQNS